MYYIYIYLVIHVLSSFPTYCFFILFIHLFSATLNLHHYAQALFSCGAQGLLSICGAWACHCSGLSCCGAWSWTRVPCFGRWIRNHWNTREVLPASYFLFTQICLSTSLSSFLSIPTSLSFDNFHDIVPQERKSTSVHIFISFSSMLCRLLSLILIILQPLVYHKMETSLTKANRSVSFFKFTF